MAATSRTSRETEAKNLIKRMATDKNFRQSLENAPTKDARVAILAQHGFANVALMDVRGVAKNEGLELTNEQLIAVAAGLNIARPVEWAKVVVAAAALFV